MSYNSITKTYEINAPEESIQLIKVQNKKIKELYNDIDKKDNIIKQYEDQIKNSQNYYEQNNQLRIQVDKLMEELKNKQKRMEYNEINSKSVVQREKELANQLLNMKNSYETEIGKYLSDLKIKTEQVNVLQKENDELKNTSKLLALKVDKLEKDNLINVEKIGQYALNEKGFQSRAKELVEIIETQDEEIKNFQNEINLLQSKYQKMNEENSKIKTAYSSTVSTYQTLEEKNKESENIILSFNNQLQNEKNKVFDLSTSLNSLTNELSVMKLKLNEQIALNKEKDKALTSINQEKNELIYQSDSINQKFQQYINSIEDTISYITSTIYTALKWGDTYIGNHIGQKEIPLLDNCNMNQSNETNAQNLLILTQKVIDGIRDIYNKTNNDYKRYDKTINDYETGKQNLLLQIEELNKNINHFSEQVKNGDQVLCSLKEKDNENNDIIVDIQSKLVNLSKINENYETEIIQFYNHLYIMLNSSRELLQSNELYRNIFANVDIEKPENNVINKLMKIKEISVNFEELAINLVKIINEKDEAIKEYEIINEECKNLRKEILDIKKGYSTQANTIIQEKENMISSYEKNKMCEIQKIETELRAKIEKLENEIKEKEEEIEKLNNDNNLLYSQYLLSEKNFDEYKRNRKNYE